jgi:hypothetical protein
VSIPRHVVRVADGSRVPQLTVKLADNQTPAQATLRVAESGERAQYTVKIAEEGDRAQMTAVLEGYSAESYADRVLALTPIAYYELNGDATDSSGNGYDGAATGATFGADGIGDDNTAATFDGTGDVIDISAIIGAFDPDLGSIVVWGKTSAWADATARTLVSIAADGADSVSIGKTATTNQLQFLYRANSETENIAAVSSTLLAGSTAYFCAALTWDVSGDALKAYINGTQVGTTQTGLDAFDQSLDPTLCAIGARTTAGASSWSGSIAHVAIFDRALTGAEILSLGVL